MFKADIYVATFSGFFLKRPFFEYLHLAYGLLYILLALAGIFFLLSFVVYIVRLMNDLRGPRVIFEITPPKQTALSPLTTTELFNILFGVISSRTLLDRLTLRSLSLSFEIVSQKESGIRYLVSVPTQISPQIDRTLRGYLPGMSIRVAEDYVITDSRPVVTQYKLGKHFAYPINTQEQLGQHDPLAYLTASMSKLESDELMAIQVVMRPQVRHQQAKKIRSQIESGRYLQATSTIPLLNWTESFVRLMVSPLLIVADAITGQPPLPKLERVERLLTKQESQYAQLIQSKLSQPLFRVSIRTMVIAKRSEASSRDKGLRASFVSFAHETGQVLRPQYEPRIGILQRFRNWQLSKRLLSSGQIVSSSEIAALYHFPYLTSHHAEDLIRVKSPEFPAPLSLKNNPDLDVMFGKNTFANSSVSVGLTDEDRSRHVYLIGQTGSGKSTVMYHMAKDDIRKGRGLAVIDPHGDLAEDLLATIPEERRKDLIYFNPFDIKFPVGINLLELTPYEDEDDRELERELVCESVISVFRRVFSKDENTDAHRIEYILRNAIYTAFTVKDSTIFTVYDLLNTPSFRKEVVKNLKDENLRIFWKNEFGRAGDYQVVKMVGGVTAKVGRFLFSPTAKRILEQPKSTIRFDELLAQNKILLCNLAEGKIGEDTAQLLGTTVIAKVQQAVVRRVREDKAARIPFYLFIDEFQNFATSSFTKLLSGGRKFGLRVTIAQQSTAQISDRDIVNVILANTGTVICFRTASPVDEELMLAQLTPTVMAGDITNLPRYHFYMRLSAVEPSAPFSGETLPVSIIPDIKLIEGLIEESRNNYAVEYKRESMPEMPKTKTMKPVIPAADGIEVLG